MNLGKESFAKMFCLKSECPGTKSMEFILMKPLSNIIFWTTLIVDNIIESRVSIYFFSQDTCCKVNV